MHRADLSTLLAVARAELDRVDHKAEVLFTGSGVATGAIVAGALAGQWSPSMLEPLASILLWTGLIAWIGALVCLAAAVYPRTHPARRGDDSPLIAYFVDVAGLSTPTELNTALRRGTASSGMALIDQLFRISKIVKAKYRCLHAALWLLALGAGCTTATLAIQHW